MLSCSDIQGKIYVSKAVAWGLCTVAYTPSKLLPPLDCTSELGHPSCLNKDIKTVLKSISAFFKIFVDNPYDAEINVALRVVIS